jgi:hypothetical protein
VIPVRRWRSNINPTARWQLSTGGGTSYAGGFVSTAPSLEDNRDFVLVEETAAICDSASTPAYAERAFRPVDSWRYCFVKRGIDFSGAVILSLLFLAPGVLIALAIYLSSPGAVFYREERVGRNGRPFRIWKFR